MKLLCLYILLCVFRLPAVADAPSVLLAAVGDVMLGRTVAPRITAHGPAWAWEQIDPFLLQADLRFCNLECPLTEGGQPVPKRYSFRADPEQAGKVLQAGGFHVAALANNHTYDYGRPGLSATLAHVEALGIAAPGAGKGRAGAIAPRLLTVNGLRIAFVAYSWWWPEGYLPQDDGASLATLDEATLADELRAAKVGADLLVVSIHWGKEYSRVPTDGQRRVARLAIDAGADLILGHHPHVAQPVEIYQQRPIAYSLGNCLFDRSDARMSNGLLLLVRLAPGKVTVEQQVTLKIEDARPVPQEIGKE